MAQLATVLSGSKNVLDSDPHFFYVCMDSHQRPAMFLDNWLLSIGLSLSGVPGNNWAFTATILTKYVETDKNKKNKEK